MQVLMSITYFRKFNMLTYTSASATAVKTRDKLNYVRAPSCWFTIIGSHRCQAGMAGNYRLGDIGGSDS
jgi:hypothetical protein